MDEDDYRQLLFEVTGHGSAADCSDGQLSRVIERLKEKGFWSPDPPTESAEPDSAESGTSGEVSSDEVEEVAAVTAGEIGQERVLFPSLVPLCDFPYAMGFFLC